MHTCFLFRKERHLPPYYLVCLSDGIEKIHWKGGACAKEEPTEFWSRSDKLFQKLFFTLFNTVR